MTGSVPRHPEAQTMAAFVEGTLAPSDTAAVAAHLRDCAECRTVVAETARFEREEQPMPARRARPAAWWLAAAALLAAIAITIPLLRWNESRRASPIAHLIDAAPRDHRFVPARLSGFPWARLQAPPRGVAPADPADLKLNGAAGDVLEKTANQTTPEARHAAGVAQLLIGRPMDAIAALEQAANNSKDARVWNDLAAARLARAIADDRPSQLPLALADADRALRLDPTLPEAHFNRALILERLGIRDHARKEWQRYLDLEPGSEWSLEARQHLHALDGNSVKFDPKLLESTPPAQLVREFPQEARTSGEGTLLAAWADSESSGDVAGASATLARIRAIANALAASRGEHLLEDTVAAIDRADGNQRRTLVEGHRLYRDARIDYRNRDAGAAEKRFRRAADLFRQGGSAMANVAWYYAATAAFDQHRVGEARSELARLRSTIDRNRHRALAAQIEWALAVAANTEGDWGTGAREAETASALFRSLGETSNAAFVDNIAAISFEMMGERDLAWTRRIRTWTIFGARGEQSRQTVALHGAASTLAFRDELPAAEALLELIVQDGRGDAAQLAAVLADRARAAVRRGDVDAARRSIAEARAAAMRVSDPALRNIVGTEIDLADAAMRREREPRAAIASLDRTIAFLAGGRLRVLLPEALLQRARAFHAAGDDDAALAGYAAALREIEEQRASIQDLERGLSFLDTAAHVIEETIELQLTRGAIAEAFAVADRTRGLLETAPFAQSAAPVTVPRDVAVLEYVVLPRAIALFCVTSDGITAERIAVDRRELASRVESFTANLRRRAPLHETRTESGALYQLLIAPVRQRLTGVRELVLVPDRQLYGVPFAALWNAATGRYLAEELTIRFAPAASAAETESDRSHSPALVVADPPAARWPRLPASREEGARIASLYGATLLEGEAATRVRFLEFAKRSALIHYAGHANSDAGESWGALLLAGGDGDSGIVGSGEIAALAFLNRPLVVLAACGTFRGNAAHVAGMSSLARSFLIAGARGVVGTLWEVDDDVSSVLFSRFHHHLHAGAPPADALRAAQREMLHAADARLRHPATWAPVVYFNND